MAILRILGVDDEQGMRTGIERALENYVAEIPDINDEVSFEISLVETGEEAVRAIEENTPDILLLDYKLPDIDGLEVLEKTAGKTGDMLTIMITAYASIETAIAATKQGAYDFLPKPFTPADLKNAVRKAATRIILARRARELEAEKKRVRFEFIRVLGHELKAPLNSVSSYMYLCRDHVLGNDIGGYDEMIGRSLLRLDQMRKLIVDLLDMTKLESGERVRKLKEVDLSEAVNDSIELVSEEAEKRNIKVKLSKCQASMMGDRQEIDMILNNLISNAVKYNVDGGSVGIGIQRVNGNVTISVVDTGIGMTPEEKDKLFGEFVRIRNDQTKDILGSGLGLSILKRLVELYDGDISVESACGKGSTFTVTLNAAGKEVL